VNYTKPQGRSQLTLGITHTQHTVDYGNIAAVARAQKLLGVVAPFQVQAIMGWGADNPEPSPGIYNFQTLDERIDVIRRMHATPVITLCGAPDWMKGGQAGSTDWSKLERAPLPAHYADFATLAATIARRYPDVHYYQVWNEMKGLWDAAARNWNAAGYTDLYNQVYDALKSVSPAIKVGGPYLVIEGTGSGAAGWAAANPITARNMEVLNYWIKHKHGADFIVIDRGLVDYHDKTKYTPDQAMKLTHWFGDVAEQVHKLTDLPVWYAEYYGGGSSDRAFIAAEYASIYASFVRSGVAKAFLWGPMDDGNGDWLGSTALVSSARQPDGGSTYPHYDVFKLFHDHFAAGTQIFHAVSSSEDVDVLASRKCTLLINQADAAVAVRLAGQTYSLKPYQVLAVDGAPTLGIVGAHPRGNGLDAGRGRYRPGLSAADLPKVGCSGRLTPAGGSIRFW
jgi:hypothetical protein